MNGENTASTPVETKKPRKPGPVSKLAILKADTLEVVDATVTDETLAAVVEKLDFGSYVLRRYTDRSFEKKEIKRAAVKFG